MALLGAKHFCSVVPQAPMGCMMPILIITVASSKTSMPRISTIAYFSPCKYSIRNEVVECDTVDDTDDDNDHKKDSYTAAGAAPDAGAAPGPGLRKHQNPNKTQT